MVADHKVSNPLVRLEERQVVHLRGNPLVEDLLGSLEVAVEGSPQEVVGDSLLELGIRLVVAVGIQLVVTMDIDQVVLHTRVVLLLQVDRLVVLHILVALLLEDKLVVPHLDSSLVVVDRRDAQHE